MAGVWTAGTTSNILASLVAWASLLFVPVFFIRRRAKEAPAFEFGVLLVSISLTFGSVASHDISQVDFFTGQAALGGFSLFGKPLIYATSPLPSRSRPWMAAAASPYQQVRKSEKPGVSRSR